MCRDARYVSSGMASVPVKAIRVLTLGRITRYRDARSVRPLCQRLQHRGFDEDGRTDRASLQRVTRHAGRRRTHRSCVPTAGYTSRFDEDGRTHRSAPTTGYTSRWSETDALSLDTSRAPLQRATGLIRRLVRFAERIFHSKMQFAELRSVLACASKKKLPLRQAVQ